MYSVGLKPDKIVKLAGKAGLQDFLKLEHELPTWEHLKYDSNTQTTSNESSRAKVKFEPYHYSFLSDIQLGENVRFFDRLRAKYRPDVLTSCHSLRNGSCGQFRYLANPYWGTVGMLGCGKDLEIHHGKIMVPCPPLSLACNVFLTMDAANYKPYLVLSRPYGLYRSVPLLSQMLQFCEQHGLGLIDMRNGYGLNGEASPDTKILRSIPGIMGASPTYLKQKTVRTPVFSAQVYLHALAPDNTPLGRQEQSYAPYAYRDIHQSNIADKDPKVWVHSFTGFLLLSPGDSPSINMRVLDQQAKMATTPKDVVPASEKPKRVYKKKVAVTV